MIKMTTNTKARPKPAAPKAKAPANTSPSPKVPANVPETDPAPKPATAPAARGGNSAYADEETRAKITQAMADLREKGFTRPSISDVTGFTDSQVWRAQNNKVHASEVDALVAFIKKVVDGEVKPPTTARKPKAADLEAKITKALGTLAELDPKATVTALRKALAEVKETLEA